MKVASPSSSLIVSVPPVLKLVSSVTSPASRRHPFDDRRRWVRLIVTVVSCSVPSADVTVKVSINVSPSPSSWVRQDRALFRVRPAPSVPIRPGAVPYGPAVSVCAVGRSFARIVITDRQCTPVLQLVSSVRCAVHAVTRSGDQRIVEFFVDHVLCLHTLCRLPTRVTVKGFR